MDSAVLLRASTVLALLTGAISVAAADDPSDPAAPAAADRFRSTFSDYRPYAQADRPEWRDALQEVAPRAGAKGGHEDHAGHADHGAHEQHEVPETPAAHDDHGGREDHGPRQAPPPAPEPADHSRHKHQ
jgi:hypothetical protein